MIISNPYNKYWRNRKLKKENMVVVRKQKLYEPMMDKSNEVEEQNRLRDWRRQNHDEAKEIVTQVEKSREIVV